ncbi:MAG: CocE/NonD family hydrolase [Crocinitomicaceae bacterium]|nr:CocE/NonD family hydrolase [Crocinitomicaceae bacterium]
MKYALLSLLFVFSNFFSFSQSFSSQFITMPDGVNLAADIYLPEGYTNEKLPVLVMFERYWRSSVNRKNKDEQPTLYGRGKLFSDNGYAIVVVDTRGSGASFGTRLSEYSPEEVMDAKSVVDWIISQTWSNGNVGSYGTSYTGTTAELLCATKHPAVKAVIPGWSDFDLYRSPVRPYGLIASKFVRKWGVYVRLLDRNRSMLIGSKIRPVIKDSLKPALKDHKENMKVFKSVEAGHYRNGGFENFDYESCSVVRWKKEIEESNVPMLVLTSWMDAGTSEGTIQRLEHFSNPQKVILMSTAHGGWCNASPFSVGDSLLGPIPPMQMQNQQQLDFFDHYLKGIDKGVEEWPLVRYFNMGEEKFKKSDQWPIAGTSETKYFFNADGGLSQTAPVETDASDSYKVDFGVSTSKNNRWTTQMEGPVKNLNNRNEMDERMLVYTSQPATEDIQITGTPVVRLKMTSSHEDGAVLVYLEDVDENGKSTYITEGGLRLIHRKEAVQDEENFNMHSFNEEDVMPMVEGEVAEVAFKLWPTSVLIKKGHSIRIAIAGADKSIFDKFPKNGKPTYEIMRNVSNMSFVELPIVLEE